MLVCALRSTAALQVLWVNRVADAARSTHASCRCQIENREADCKRECVLARAVLSQRSVVQRRAVSNGSAATRVPPPLVQQVKERFFLLISSLSRV